MKWRDFALMVLARTRAEAERTELALVQELVNRAAWTPLRATEDGAKMETTEGGDRCDACAG